MTSRTRIAVELNDILIIEDNEDHLSLTLEALEEAGLRNPVQTATTLAQARAYLRSCAERAKAGRDSLPCVILLDVRLPDGSGIEVLREVKQEPILRSIPVVVLTSSDDTPDVQSAYLLGANSYLVKPISFEEFHRKVRDAGLYWALLNHWCQPEHRD
jgi:CheY-like chemotaxis protein